MEQVIIGVDPHKLSATIEVVDEHERKLGDGRFPTDRAGYTAMQAYVTAWPARVWAVEGANGAGRSLAQRLLEAGEIVVDVPAKLAARVRLFDTGHNRKTDAHDAHSIAAVAVRTKSLRVLTVDGAAGAAVAGRPPGRAEQAPGTNRQPVARVARRTASGTDEEGHHRATGQGPARLDPAP
ncbi:MAG TPA: transposase [Dermatophilaceae bacterium]